MIFKYMVTQNMLHTLKKNRYFRRINNSLFYGIFKAAHQVLGHDAHLSYNIALCHYRLKDFAPALKHIADIIEKGIR